MFDFETRVDDEGRAVCHLEQEDGELHFGAIFKADEVFVLTYTAGAWSHHTLHFTPPRRPHRGHVPD